MTKGIVELLEDMACAKHDDLFVVEEAAAEIRRLRERVAELEVRKDAAYLERNQVVAALASVFPSGTKQTNIEGWSRDWHGCVYIDLPTGQVSWHYHDSQAHLFEHLSVYAGEWDGHDTEEKYRRVLSLRKTADRYAEGFSHAREMAIDAIGGQCCRVDTICVEAIRTMQPEENP